MNVPPISRIEQVDAWLDGFTYKPNWEFEVYAVACDPSRDPSCDPSCDPSRKRLAAEVQSSSEGPVVLACKAYVPDSCVEHHTKVTTVGYRYLASGANVQQFALTDDQPLAALYQVFSVPQEIQTRRDFIKWVYFSVVTTMERHEQDEWFKVDGVAIHNPHQDQPPGWSAVRNTP